MEKEPLEVVLPACLSYLHITSTTHPERTYSGTYIINMAMRTVMSALLNIYSLMTIAFQGLTITSFFFSPPSAQKSIEFNDLKLNIIKQNREKCFINFLNYALKKRYQKHNFPLKY